MSLSPTIRPISMPPQLTRRALGFLKPYRLKAVLALIALIVTAGVWLAVGQGLRWFMDRVLLTRDVGLIDHSMIALFVLVAIMTVGTYIRFYLIAWIGERVVADIRRAVYANLMALDAAFFETSRTGDVLSRLTADTATVQAAVGVSLSMALRNVLLLAGGLVLMTVANLKLTLIAVVLVPLVVIPVVKNGRRVKQLSRDSQDRLADVGARAEETLNAARTVRAFGHETADRQAFDRDVEAAFTAASQRNAARGILIAVVVFLVFGGIAALLWVGGHDVLAGRMSGGELMAFLFYAILAASSAGILSEVAGDIFRAAGAVERLMELLDVAPTVIAPERPVPLPSPPRGAVAFESVTFHYPARPDTPAIDDLTLTIEPGETVALVGPSGAGKTTALHLLLRFYDPQAGAIRIDGVNIREADPADVRARIGLVPQDPVIFSANVWDNIRYGRPGASDEDVIEAARAAHALEFIETLPEGFGSYLGEKGIRLSGGQQQRVAIARALLRDPAILLLDEATSSLDAESERVVQGALANLMKGRTTLVIAHRLATVIRADRLAVLDRGKLVAIGPHRELLRTSPLYAHLAGLQFGHGQILVDPE